MINLTKIFDKKANVNICKNFKYAKYVKLTNKALMVKTRDITNILMEEIFFVRNKKSQMMMGEVSPETSLT